MPEILSQDMSTSEKPKSKDPNYFNQGTEDAITKFQQASSIPEKQQIFVENIRPAFLKLIENIIFVYKFHTLR